MRNAWIFTPAALLLVAVASYVAYRSLLPGSLPDGLLYANGRVEGTEVRISSEVPGRVVESNLVEGKLVEAGGVLVRVDPTDLSLRRAQQDAERSALERTLERLGRELDGARHHLATAERDATRYRALEARGTIAAQRLDQSENLLQESRTRVLSLEASRAQTAAQLEAIGQSLRLIDTQLGKTEIRAPGSSTILVKAVEPGELLAVGQTVAVLVDLSQIEVKLYFPESEIGRVKLGDQARIRVDAFPDRYFTGTVARVDERAQFTPRDIHVPDERVRTVFGATVVLDNPEGILKPGMPVDAWLRWRADVPWPASLKAL